MHSITKNIFVKLNSEILETWQQPLCGIAYILNVLKYFFYKQAKNSQIDKNSIENGRNANANITANVTANITANVNASVTTA